MKRYLLLFGGTVGLLFLLFRVVQALEVPLLTDTDAVLQTLGALAAPVAVGLLVADVVLPVPSSLVMVADGALFGVVGGTLLSLAGTLGAGLLAFYLGRSGGPLLARLVSPAERARADRLLDRWGDLAVVVTRPVPILAETVALLAGTSPMTWKRMTLATFAGGFPPSLLYAVAGARAAALGATALVFTSVVAVAALLALVAARLRNRRLTDSMP